MKKLKWISKSVDELQSGKFWIIIRQKGARKFELNHKYSFCGAFKKLSSAKKVANLMRNG